MRKGRAEATEGANIFHLYSRMGNPSLQLKISVNSGDKGASCARLSSREEHQLNTALL